MAIEYELRKCDFCRRPKPVLMKTKIGRHDKKICLDCHTRQEAVEKKHHREFGTHDPEDMFRMNLL